MNIITSVVNPFWVAVELVKQRSNLFPKKDLLRALTSGDEKTISAFLTEIK